MKETFCDMFTLIDLPYAPDALAPVISAQTLSFHHGKHLQAYVNNLNAALAGSPLEGLPLEEVVVKSEGGMRNNAGQTLNHNLYFLQFSPTPAKTAPPRRRTSPSRGTSRRPSPGWA